MAKRRRLSYSSDEFFASDGSASDWNPEPKPTPTRSKRTQITKRPKQGPPQGRAKKALKKSRDVDAEDSDAVASPSRVTPHGASTHIVSDVEPLRKALLEWYSKVHETRGMPWRKPYDSSLGPEARSQRAYEVWISEIMLQQTQVATVKPYYNAWMEKFPSIRDLAASDIDTVNGSWKGLGYYSRAARLLNGAKKVVNELGGRLPDNAKDMESKIPGVGRYSAGAICSIAYNECVPVLDGNVHRLLSRVLALHALPKAKQSLDVLWNGATSMVEGSDRPGDLNQALIELGSTVCKVRDPSCETCPLRQWCRAHKCQNAGDKGLSGVNTHDVPDIEELCSICEPLPHSVTVTMFPMKAERKKAREELDIVNVIEWRPDARSNERWFLLVRRPEGGLLAGLHEFPTKADVSSTISPASMSSIPSELLSDLLTKQPRSLVGHHESSDESSSTKPAGPPPEVKDGDITIVKIKPAGDVLHIFSHIKKTYRIQWVLLEGGGTVPPPLANTCLSIGETLPRNKNKAKVDGKSKSKKVPHVHPTGMSHGGWTLMDDVPRAK
ncbi:hypothetical protein QCA50_013360 [Cerrena zonata]|uniref:Adenine DNA glycosylase n=1 Tax=Cerrena zonata TaxID=2478898 RepID=A0AAW0FRW8_9APHY